MILCETLTSLDADRWELYRVALPRDHYTFRPHTQTLSNWVGPKVLNPGGLTCGANPGSAIVPDYQAQAPFPFTGTLHTVTIDLSGDLITDTESEMRMAMARQ